MNTAWDRIHALDVTYDERGIRPVLMSGELDWYADPAESDLPVFAGVIDVDQPESFALSVVRGFGSPRWEDERNRDLRLLRDAPSWRGAHGYVVDWRVLGPNERRRSYIYGRRADLAGPDWAVTWPASRRATLQALIAANQG